MGFFDFLRASPPAAPKRLRRVDRREVKRFTVPVFKVDLNGDIGETLNWGIRGLEIVCLSRSYAAGPRITGSMMVGGEIAGKFSGEVVGVERSLHVNFVNLDAALSRTIEELLRTYGY